MNWGRVSRKDAKVFFEAGKMSLEQQALKIIKAQRIYYNCKFFAPLRTFASLREIYFLECFFLFLAAFEIHYLVIGWFALVIGIE